MTDEEILKKQGHTVYSDSYLQSMKKEWLIDYIRCLEHNWAAEEERNARQYRLLIENDIKNRLNDYNE